MAEGAPLLRAYTFTRIEGSNPFLSATQFPESDVASLLHRYVPGHSVDQRVAWIDVSAGETYYFHANRLGSVQAVVDSSGTVTDRYVYTPFGVQEPLVSTGNPFRYTGRRDDPEIGVYIYRARYYDADHGRFLQTDPIGYYDQVNLYAYVANNPINATDPTGMATVCNGNDSCVEVDGNGDGDVSDDDLTDKQKTAFGEDYSDFIDGNDGRKISEYGKDVVGTATDSQKDAVRAASQFVGAAANDAGGDQAAAWGAVDYIDAQTRNLSFLAGSPANLQLDANGKVFIQITGRSMGGFNRNMYNRPSDLARFMIHEPRHLLYPRNITRGDHRQLDSESRGLLNQYGLGGGGCAGGFGFPSC